MRAWAALALLALALGGCRARTGRGYAIGPGELTKLKTPNQDGPFSVESEGGAIRVGPESRFRFKTKGEWSEWVSAKVLRTDGRGISVFRTTELTQLDAIRIEQPTPELLFALQTLCAGNPGEDPCGAHLRVFPTVGETPLLQVRLRATCMTPALDALVVDRVQVPDPLTLPAPDAPGACGFSLTMPALSARLCEQADLCPSQAWVAAASSMPAVSLSGIAAIELWDTQSLTEKVVRLGQAMRVGRWFFMPDNRFSGGMFEQHGSVQLATTAGDAQTGSLGQYLFWALSDPKRPAAPRARAALRVERPMAEVVRPIREGCDEAAKNRARYDDGVGEWIAPCTAVVRVYTQPSQPAFEGALSQLEVSEDDERLLWFQDEGAARHQAGEVPLKQVLALELSFFPGPLGLVMRSLASYVDRVKWLRWSVYVWDPSGLVPFEAPHGQLSTDASPRFLVERAFLPWEAMEGIEVESPSALDGLFGGR